ncbi:MAG: ribosome maturation factor RimM [Actinomycetes bacterium]
MRVVVGRLGRAHGIRGEVSVDVRTDEPDRRFAPGTVLFTDSPTTTTVVVEWAKWHSGRLLLHLEGVNDRTGAEALRGLLLEVDAVDAELPDGDDEYYDRHLVGLSVVMLDGTPVGSVREVVHLPMQDMLVVGRDEQTDLLVPFVSDFVPTVDVPGGTIVIDPPPGLIDEGEPV